MTTQKTTISCPICDGSGLDKEHQWPDGSFAACERCDGYGYFNDTEIDLDTLRAANHRLASQVDRLIKLLGEAWLLGADHRKPSFEQLNEWRNAFSRNK